MHIVGKVVSLMLVIALQGCASHAKLSGVPSAEQKTVFKDGRKALISSKQNTVIVAPETDRVGNGERGEFILLVNKGTAADLDFSTEDVTAYVQSHDALTELAVFSYDQLVAEEETRQAWAALAAAMQGLGDAMNAANAGYSMTRGTYSGSNYSGYGGNRYGYGTYSGTTYNHAAAQAAQNTAQANSQARFARIEAEGQANLQSLSTRMLRKETVFPGAWHGGIVKVQLPRVAEQSQEMRLVVFVGKETHAFNFAVERVQE